MRDDIGQEILDQIEVEVPMIIVALPSFKRLFFFLEKVLILFLVERSYL